MGNIKIGNVELGKVPRVVAIINDIMPIDSVKGIQERGAALLEIRVDLFSADFDTIIEYLRKLKRSIEIPLIGTIRETEDNRDKRLSMFECLIPLIDAIDIEIDSDINHDVISKAEGKTKIVSEHNFEKTPSDDELSQIIETAKNFGADIIKIAAMANSKEDVTRLLDFTKTRSENLVTISMGEIGKQSRIEAPKFGSLFTYAFINEKVAPGQISFEEMVEEFKARYPDF
ncbi:type I 3-dehydroquinate dehydratase [Fibrobacterota bacterium]